MSWPGDPGRNGRATRRIVGRASVALFIGAMALLLRLPGLTSGLPYLGYVDEGWVLHSVVGMLERGDWDPGWYGYPTLPAIITAAAIRAYAPLFEARHGFPLRSVLSSHPAQFYDVVEPHSVILIGRLVVLLASLSVIGIVGFYAAQFGGFPAGAYAALVASVLPAMVIRGALVSVDPFATLFVLLAFFTLTLVAKARRPLIPAAAAGALLGLAIASKYTAALAGIGLTTVLVLRRRGSSRGTLLAAAGAGTLVVFALMPVLLSREGLLAVWMDLEAQASVYATQGDGTPSYLQQLLVRAEWDHPAPGPEAGAMFLALALGGTVHALRHQGIRPDALGWVVFGLAALVVLSAWSFQPFRNLLPVVGLGCVSAGLLLSSLRRRIRWPGAFDLAVIGCLALSYVSTLAPWARFRASHTDTRVAAVDWILSETRAEERVVFLHDLAWTDSELRRVARAHRFGTTPEEACQIAESWGARWVVTGIPAPSGKELEGPLPREAIPEGWQLRELWGEVLTPSSPWSWRTNEQLVLILETRSDGIDRDPR